MKLKEKLRSGLLASETFFPIQHNEDLLIDTVYRVLETSFYARLELGTIRTPSARQQLRQIANRVPVTQWITSDLNEESLNPSTVDSALRVRTIERIRELVMTAAESGADRVALISGQDPGPDFRADAAKGLEEVLCAAAQSAATADITIMLEPLDRGAHKNNFIGPTSEAMAVLDAVRRTYPNVLLSWDSAHVALNGENLLQSLSQSFCHVGQIHLSNAVLSRTAPDFGDWHMPMGAPGFLTAEMAFAIAACAAKRLPDGKTMGISVESRSHTADEVLKNEEKNRRFLQAVLEQEI